MSYPSRDIDRTEGTPMYPEGHPTQEEHDRMADHAKATRINKARKNGLVADFFCLAEQDQYIQSSSVKSMMYDVADGADHLTYELGTLYLHDEKGHVVGRVQIEEHSPFPFGKRPRQGAPMCLALSRPSDPIDTRHDQWRVTWTREERLVETEQVSVHQGPHGIQWARVWDQEAVAETLADRLDTDPPALR